MALDRNALGNSITAVGSAVNVLSQKVDALANAPMGDFTTEVTALNSVAQSLTDAAIKLQAIIDALPK